MQNKTTFLGLSAIIMAAALSFCSCTKNEDAPSVEGTWTQPVPGMEEQSQGFTLNADGSAQSVNMSTLQYTSWSQPDPETLIMNGESIGNGQSFEFSDTLTIRCLTSDSLVLSRDQFEMAYTRE